MTWDELAALLVELSEGRVHVLRGDPALDVVNLPIVPVAYFVSMRADEALIVGTYDEGPEHRLQGGERIPLSEVSEADVRRRVGAAYAEREAQAEIVLDPAAVREFLLRSPRRPGSLADDEP